MEAADFSIFDVLDFRPDSGLVNFGERRVLIFDGDILMELRRMIIESLGWPNAQPVVFSYGYQVGRRDAKTLAEIYKWKDKETFLTAGLSMQTQRGYCKSIMNHFSHDPDKEQLDFRGRWYNSFEVDSHKHLSLTDTGPVCFVLSGYLSGYASICFGRKVLVQEVGCFSRQHCSFEGKFVEEWGEQGLIFMKTSQNFDIRKTYEHLDKELIARRSKKIITKGNHIEQGNPDSREPEWLPYRSKIMSEILALSRRVAVTNANVLITGGTGVGKEVIAKYIHCMSPRVNSNFMAINCTALPEALLESELFGHLKGSFTSADHDKKGLLFEVGSGTILLDEIGDVPLSIQVKLLRALQDKKVRPVGGASEIKINARLITSTNRNLEQMMKDGKFRADLYYRLNVFPIHIPDLHERKDDILPIARYFLSKYAPACLGFSPVVAQHLENYDWPGNVRELANAIEHAAILADNQKIQIEHLPAALQALGKASILDEAKKEWVPLKNLEKKYILSVMKHCGGKKMEAAKILGIAGNTLWRKLKQYDIKPADDDGI